MNTMEKIIAPSGSGSPYSISKLELIIMKISARFYPLVIAVIVLTLLIIVWRFTSPSGLGISHKIPTVLITGPTNSGKTALYFAWQVPDESIETVTSTTANIADEFALNSKYRLVDCPGHPKLRHHFNNYIAESDVSAVVFVVDGACGVEGVKAAARQLMAVLEITSQKEIPVLIAVNKNDLFSSLSVLKVKRLLEAEINELRALKSSTVQSSEKDESWDPVEQLGIDGKNFEFADLCCDLAILDGSAKMKKLSKWEGWLNVQLRGA